MQSRPPAARIKGTVRCWARIFGFPRRRVLNHARASRGAKGKGAVDNIEETRGWRWSETLGGHTVNRVSSSFSSSRVLAGNDTLSRKSRGWNERASLSASNCDRVVVEEIVDPFTIRSRLCSPEKMFSGRAKKKKKKKEKGRGGELE